MGQMDSLNSCIYRCMLFEKCKLHQNRLKSPSSHFYSVLWTEINKDVMKNQVDWTKRVQLSRAEGTHWVSREGKKKVLVNVQSSKLDEYCDKKFPVCITRASWNWIVAMKVMPTISYTANRRKVSNEAGRDIALKPQWHLHWCSVFVVREVLLYYDPFIMYVLHVETLDSYQDKLHQRSYF